LLKKKGILRNCISIYAVPVITMFRLKLVRMLKLAAVVRVRFAEVILFGASTVFWRFQTQVIELLMVEGDQLVLAKLNVSGVVPEFLR
jgi:hypothetical protein